MNFMSGFTDQMSQRTRSRAFLLFKSEINNLKSEILCVRRSANPHRHYTTWMASWGENLKRFATPPPGRGYAEPAREVGFRAPDSIMGYTREAERSPLGVTCPRTGYEDTNMRAGRRAR